MTIESREIAITYLRNFGRTLQRAWDTGLKPGETLALRVSSIREYLRNKRPKTDGRRQITRANLCPTTESDGNVRHGVLGDR